LILFGRARQDIPKAVLPNSPNRTKLARVLNLNSIKVTESWTARMKKHGHHDEPGGEQNEYVDEVLACGPQSPGSLMGPASRCNRAPGKRGKTGGGQRACALARMISGRWGMALAAETASPSPSEYERIRP